MTTLLTIATGRDDNVNEMQPLTLFGHNVGSERKAPSPAGRGELSDRTGAATPEDARRDLRSGCNPAEPPRVLRMEASMADTLNSLFGADIIVAGNRTDLVGANDNLDLSPAA